MLEPASERSAPTLSSAGTSAAPRELLLVGNPNVGKSVLFGCLTRRYVTVANYPGTTIEVTRGSALLGGIGWSVLDTPGTNQLLPVSEDERVTRNIILDTPAGTVLQVADAKNLRRALALTLELSEMGVPVTLALNMQDEARRRGVAIRRSRLEEILGIPVVETTATRREGIARLIQAVPSSAVPRAAVVYPPQIEQQIARLLPCLASQGSRARFLAVQLLCGEASILSWLGPRLSAPDLEEIRSRLASSEVPADAVNQVRLARLDTVVNILAEVYREGEPVQNSHSDRLSRWSMHPLKGTLMLAALFYVFFWFVGLFGAGTLVDLMQRGVFGQILNPLAERIADVVLPFPHAHGMTAMSVDLRIPLLPGRSIPLGVVWAHQVPSLDYTIPVGVHLTRLQQGCRLLHDFLVGPYGIFTMGLSYGFAIVLPIVATFFLLFSLLEDSGYLPRLAVMVNDAFKGMGLNGKAVLPWCSGWAATRWR